MSQSHSIKDIDTVIYHANCSDGIGAAWVIYHLARKNSDTFNDIEFLGYNDRENPPNLEGKNVVIVDFSFIKSKMLEIIAQAKSVLVLDHHDTAQKDLEGLDAPNFSCVFDMSRSGAKIAWDYYHPDRTSFGSTPWFILYIQDRDLWQWKLNNSKAISECLYKERRVTFEGLENLYRNIKNGMEIEDMDYMIAKGGELLGPKEDMVMKYTRMSKLCTFTIPDFSEFTVRAIDCPRELRSDVGNRIVTLYDDCMFALLWSYDLETDEWWCSLRGGRTDINLADVAKTFGNGGGHKNAAGFCIKTHLRDHVRVIKQE